MSSVLYKIFDGSVTALANSFISMEAVNLEEIERIKQILKKKEKELRSKNND
jgi:predicted transcriptional regulator